MNEKVRWGELGEVHVPNMNVQNLLTSRSLYSCCAFRFFEFCSSAAKWWWWWWQAAWMTSASKRLAVK
jgi:hypothetical protein